MQAKSGLYIGETAETPIGKLWLAVSDLGLVAIECGLTRDEFEAYLGKRFKQPVQPDPQRVLKAAGQIDRYLSGLQRAFGLAVGRPGNHPEGHRGAEGIDVAARGGGVRQTGGCAAGPGES